MNPPFNCPYCKVEQKPDTHVCANCDTALPMMGTFYVVYGNYGICHVVYRSVYSKEPGKKYPRTVCGRDTMSILACSYKKKDLDGYGVCKTCFKDADYCEEHNHIAYDFFTKWDHAIREHLGKKDKE